VHPTCVRCGAPATVVNHKIPHRGDMKLFWNRSNWESYASHAMTAQFNPRKSADQTKKRPVMTLQTFTPPIQPSVGATNKPKVKILKADFGDGYTQAAADGTNNIRAEFSLTWKF